MRQRLPDAELNVYGANQTPEDAALDNPACGAHVPLSGCFWATHIEFTKIRKDSLGFVRVREACTLVLREVTGKDWP